MFYSHFGKIESCFVTVLCAHWRAPGAPKIRYKGLGTQVGGGVLQTQKRLEWRQLVPLPRMFQDHPCHLGCRENAPSPAPAMLWLPGMSPQVQQVVALGMSHHTGCRLLHAHALGLLVVFWPHGESIADPNPCDVPHGKAAVPAASVLSCLPAGMQHPPAALCGQGARGFSQDYPCNSASRGTAHVSEQPSLSMRED